MKSLFLNIYSNIAEAAEFGITNEMAFQTLIYIGNALVIINSSTNLLIYCAAGRRFRQMFAQRVFGLKLSRPSTPASSRLLLKRTSPLQQDTCHNSGQYNSLDETRELANMIAEVRRKAHLQKTLF